MADSTPRTFTRRTFIGWWMASLLTAIAAIGLAPILVFLWPAPPKGQRKVTLAVSLPKGVSALADGEAIRFDAPSSPNSAFVMADGGGDNAAGDLAFSGYVVKTGGKVVVYAINCPHLGCSYALNQDAKTFDCPCHGSRFHLDGSVLHGPAAFPLSHLTWKEGTDPTTIDVDGVILGF
jgi:Rieske Fe-S protein